jgi:glycosyltransferase involved in cell wall biosynthesis
MKVLLPTHQLAAAGIGTFIEGLSTSLSSALDPYDELLLVGERPEGLDGGNVRCVQSPALARARLGRLAFEQIGIGRATRAADVVHLPNPHALLLNSAPFVVTVHDVFFLDRPEWYPRSFVVFKRAMLDATLARSPRVVACVSDFSRRALLEHFPHLEAETRVIYPGLAAVPGTPAGDEDREPYFLTLATFEPRKNHLGLLEAFRLARTRGLTLRWKVAGIEGYGSRQLLAALRREEGVDVLGHVSNAQRERLYRRARFFAFPSLAEGFGFPPLEAMARGTPTICAAGTAMDETVGDSAIRIPPDDVEGWAAAVELLSDDADERERLREAGLVRAAEFSWERAAQEYVSSYRSALSMRPDGLDSPVPGDEADMCDYATDREARGA